MILADLFQLACAAVLLLGFAMLVLRQPAAVLATAQAGGVCIAAVLGAWADQDPSLLLIAAAAAGTGGLAFWTRQQPVPRAHQAAVPLALLATVLAMVAARTELPGFALATILLGLIAAGRRPGLGALMMCHGTLLALILSAAPLRGLAGLAISALAAFVVAGGTIPWRRA